MFSRVIDTKRDRPVVIFAALTLLCAAIFEHVSAGSHVAFLAIFVAAALLFSGRALQSYFNTSGEIHSTVMQPPPKNSTRAIAHDLRTQISIILLQLNKVSDPRVRAAEDDLKDLADAIDKHFQADQASIGTNSGR